MIKDQPSLYKLQSHRHTEVAEQFNAQKYSGICVKVLNKVHLGKLAILFPICFGVDYLFGKKKRHYHFSVIYENATHKKMVGFPDHTNPSGPKIMKIHSSSRP